jgi:type II secretory pathway pseudopilin PulG
MKGKMAFTLTELIVAVVIFALTLLALFATYETFYRTSKQQIARTITSEKLRPAVEQIERFISDSGFGIARKYLDGTTNSSYDRPYDENTSDDENDLNTNPQEATNPQTLAAFAITINNDLKPPPDVTQTDYQNTVQIHVKSIVGESPYAGNYAIYDYDRFNNNEDVLKLALELPENEDPPAIIMDLSKNLMGNSGFYNSISRLLSALSSINNGNIIFLAKESARNVDNYFYFKTIRLSINTNENSDKYAYCEGNTYNLIVQRGQERGGQPLIPCVAYFNADFGCYENKKIKWQRDICKKVKDIKLVRIGLIVQSGFINKELLYHGDNPALTFPSLGRTGTNNTPVQYALKIDDTNIKNDQRYYKWEIIERIISTPNLNY